jgi:hypothetical protein
MRECFTIDGSIEASSWLKIKLTRGDANKTVHMIV